MDFAAVPLNHLALALHPAWPVALAVASAAAGTSLIAGLDARQRVHREGARQFILPGMPARAVVVLATFVAPLLTILTIARFDKVGPHAAIALLLLSAGAWFALLHGLRRLCRTPVAWQSGYLILGRGPQQRLLAMEEIVQVRLARQSFRMFLPDGTGHVVRFDESGAEALLGAILADTIQRRPDRLLPHARALLDLA
jgi:hypothetical protein